MKITKQQLKQIIKEELESTLQEKQIKPPRTSVPPAEMPQVEPKGPPPARMPEVQPEDKPAPPAKMPELEEELAAEVRSRVYKLKPGVSEKACKALEKNKERRKNLPDVGLAEIGGKLKKSMPVKSFDHAYQLAQCYKSRTFKFKGKKYNSDVYELDKNRGMPDEYFDQTQQKLQEDGHQDVPSARRTMKTIIEDAGQMLQALEQMQDQALPTWWTNKMAVSAAHLNKLRDYLLLSGD